MERGKRQRWQLWVVAIVLFSVIPFYIYLSTRPPRDMYSFLEGRTPVSTGITRGLNGRPATQWRAYSWRGDYSDIYKRADSDFKSSGFTRVDVRSTSAAWRKREIGKPVCEAAIEAARVKPESYDAKTLPDPAYVTVIIEEELPDTWLTEARLLFSR